MIPIPSINPWILLGSGVALLSAAGSGAYLGYDYARAQCKAAEADRRELVAQIRTANLQLADGIATRTETALGNLRITNTTINREVRHEREIYHQLDSPDCSVPLSTVRVLNKPLSQFQHDRPAAGEPRLRLPGAGAAPGSPDHGG